MTLTVSFIAAPQIPAMDRRPRDPHRYSRQYAIYRCARCTLSEKMVRRREGEVEEHVRAAGHQAIGAPTFAAVMLGR